ncbi:MAG: hypothetical protein A2W27_02825 [Deltaproteobacteria bacterium RBG_16_44_11]|nr:MAG: hypothetical protein A2W27_02825 [Deltaproteobacteria bacterium RBG_16_44_11]
MFQKFIIGAQLNQNPAKYDGEAELVKNANVQLAKIFSPVSILYLIQVGAAYLFLIIVGGL